MSELSFTDKLRKRMNKRRVRNLIADLPEIQGNKIVFHSSNDFSDNCLALYEYMVSQGLDHKYEIVWLVKDVDRAKALNRRWVGGGARFVRVKDDRLNMWLYEAQREAMSARYLFSTNGFGWIRHPRPEQIYTILWHGCGYKAQAANAKKRLYLDKGLVTGPKYIDIFAGIFDCGPEKLAPIGYPRSDWFRTKKEAADVFCGQLKADANAARSVIWMPTFRKSHIARLDNGTTCGELGLPLLETEEELEEINRFCAERGVLLIIKMHNLQEAYRIGDLSNVLCIDDLFLQERDVNLYGLMACTDGMLSDYSSAAVDYMLLDKPLGYVLDDFEEYEKVRGFSFENVKDFMPGDHICTADDLKQFIEEIADGKDLYRDWRHRVNTEVNVQSDHYCRDVIEYVGLR